MPIVRRGRAALSELATRRSLGNGRRVLVLVMMTVARMAVTMMFVVGVLAAMPAGEAMQAATDDC
jgi:hypothetical protein